MSHFAEAPTCELVLGVSVALQIAASLSFALLEDLSLNGFKVHYRNEAAQLWRCWKAVKNTRKKQQITLFLFLIFLIVLGLLLKERRMCFIYMKLKGFSKKSQYLLLIYVKKKKVIVKEIPTATKGNNHKKFYERTFSKCPKGYSHLALHKVLRIINYTQEVNPGNLI